MNYRYTAYTISDKRLLQGTINGGSEEAARELLLKQGCQPIVLKPRAALPPIEEMFPILFKVKAKDVTMFSRQLATLLDAGIGIVPALQLIQENMRNRLFKKMINVMLSDLRSGKSLSEALSPHKKVFGELYCQLISVGERTGGAAESLRMAADYMEKDIVLKKKIKKALTYPTIIFFVAVIVIMVLMLFVMPAMTTMLLNMKVELPLTTRLLISVTTFVTVNKLTIFAGMLLTAVAGAFYIRSASGRYNLDQLLLRLPVIGTANLMGEMARFSRTMVLLLRVGLPLPEIMEMAKRTSSNSVVKEALTEVRAGLLHGEGLSDPMSKNRVFPSLLVQMVRVGEESGRLESTLGTIAGSYEIEADDKINAMVSLIEPAMTIGLAVIVGFIALSVITPMYAILGKFS